MYYYSQTKLLFVLIFFIVFCSCRKDEEPSSSDNYVVLPTQESQKIKGLYLLNQGLMNSNKASLDYYDYQSGYFRKNIFEQVNTSAVKGLGDVGTDLKIYGSKLYAVINMSNKVEVMTLDAKRIKVIDIKNCRHICFADGKAYVSSFTNSVATGNASNGSVIEIDTLSLEKKRTVEVGRQPEELTVIGKKLYVANSGGYDLENLENKLSVIDLESFKVIKEIEVGTNPICIRKCNSDNLLVSSNGDYNSIFGCLQIVDTKTDKLKHTFPLPCNSLCVVGDTAYVISIDLNGKIFYNMIDTQKEELLEGSFLPNNIKPIAPYGIIVDPFSKNIYIADAGDYISPGVLYCIRKGVKLFEVEAGNIPCYFAFVYK